MFNFVTIKKYQNNKSTSTSIDIQFWFGLVYFSMIFDIMEYHHHHHQRQHSPIAKIRSRRTSLNARDNKANAWATTKFANICITTNLSEFWTLIQNAIVFIMCFVSGSGIAYFSVNRFCTPVNHITCYTFYFGLIYFERSFGKNIVCFDKLLCKRRQICHSIFVN